jgi:integrase
MSGAIKGLHTNSKGYYRWQPPMRKGQRDKPIYLNTSDYVEAVKAYELAKRDWELGVATYDGTFKQAVAEYIKAQEIRLLSGDKEPATVYRAKNTLPKIDEELSRIKSGRKSKAKSYPSAKLISITKNDVEKWQKLKLTQKSERTKKPLSPSTVDTYMRVLQGFFTWCASEGKIKESPFIKIKLPKLKRTKDVKFCTVEVRDKLLENPPNEAVAFILNLGFFAGLRFEEINAMESDWIKGDVITIQATKYFKPKDKELRKIGINAKLKKFLKSYGTKEGFMYAPHHTTWNPTPSNKYRHDPKRTFQKHGQRCGIAHLSYHMLRASFATHLSMKGEKMREIARLLGDDVRTTEEHYVDHSPSNNSTDCL